MKKLAAIIVCIVLMAATTALADMPDIAVLTNQERANLLAALIEDMDSNAINEAIGTRITTYEDADLKKLQEIITNELDSRITTTTEVSYQNGDKGEEVKAIQQRLIELNYLTGTADGAFGRMTEDAVRRFQSDAGLSVTGIVNTETMKMLYSANAPKAKVYRDLNYTEISRDPDQYTGEYYNFNGKVLQVMESGNSVSLRVATKGNYDNVVYVNYQRQDDESRILEDDRVTIHARCDGLYSYTAVLGNTITLPSFTAESVSVRK